MDINPNRGTNRKEKQMNADIKTTSAVLRLTRGVALAVCVAVLAAPCGAAEDQTIIPPPGDYKMVEVVLDKGNPQQGNLTLRGGIRDGKLMVPNSLSHRIKAGELVFTADAVKGAFGWRNQKYQNQGPADAVIHQYAVEAKIAGGTITGTWKSLDGKRTGGVTGWIKTEKELQAANAFTKGRDWPFYHGPLSSFAAAPGGLTLATDLKDFRLVWKSEELMPTTNSTHYLGGYLVCASNGGGASPVVSADGKVYVNYIQPAGTESVIDKPYKGGAPLLEQLEKTAAEWKTEVGPGVREKFLTLADDVIVCMDAVTGKTLWKTVFAEKGRFQQGHKIGPMNNTPCVGDGKVFAMGSLGRVYALDAQTGKPLWEVPNITGITLKTPEGFNRFHGNAPVYIDGVVVMGNQGETLHGFDAKTGAELWKLPGKSRSLIVPSRWTHQGKDYIISMDGGRDASMKLFCIEPKSGKVVWEMDYKGGSKGISVSGDILVGLTFSLRNEPPKDPECVAWRMTPEKAERIWATTVKAHGELSAPAVNDKYVVVGAPGKLGEMQLLDLNTGKVLATAQAPLAMNEPHIFMAENLVFVSPDGSHGNSTLAVYGGTPETFKLMGSWTQPHRMATSYHCKCLVFPVVEGRIFIRGFDGIHCYDLRKRP
jgi:outer membrane protein assembly factor BamB